MKWNCIPAVASPGGNTKAFTCVTIASFIKPELANSAGLPAPEIEDDGGAVTVQFRHGRLLSGSSGIGAKPAQRRRLILSLLDSAGGGLSRRETSTHLTPHASERQVVWDLEDLKKQGLIASSGRGVSAGWQRVRTEDG